MHGAKVKISIEEFWGSFCVQLKTGVRTV